MATIYPGSQTTTVLPRRYTLTLEQGLYVAIGVLALLAHLLLLGSRALHHDETLHAEYSWRIYVGDGYLHDPLLHGPFLYYWTAFIYFLFGDSDATARLGAALFGTVAVLLPSLLRRELGRGAALLASAYLLISPAFLYVGRFIRHDIFAVTFELLAVIGLLRYLDTERPSWHYLFAVALGLMLVTMETFYLFVAIIGSYIVLVLLWQVARFTLWLLAGYGALAGFALKALPRLESIGPVPLPTEEQALAVRNQGDNDWGAYFSKVGPVLGALLGHPAMLFVLFLTLALVVTLWWTIWRWRDIDGRTRWRAAADMAPPGSLLYAVDRVPGRQWLWAIGIAFTIYVVFYMGLLSTPARPNTTALVTGVLGSFLYWLGQHGVQRGGQPDHYYLFQLAVYEPLLLIFGCAGVALVARRLIRSVNPRLRRREALIPAWDQRPTGSSFDGATSPAASLFAPGLLAWWSVFALVLYSWAGEKMPWLTIHILLPLALLSAWALERMLRWALERAPGIERARGVTWATWTLAGMAMGLIVPSLLLLTITSADAQKAIQAWFWPLLIVVALALLIGGSIVLGGARQGLLAALGSILLLLAPFTVRSSVRLSFANGDVPVEPLIYTQTAPDVARAVRNLERTSRLNGGGLDLPIRYDNETVWQWYFRDYTNTEGSRGQMIDTINEDVQAVFMLEENIAANEAELDGFIRQRYPLRWWFPECEVYRFPASDTRGGCDPASTSLLGRFLRRPWDGPAIAEVWQFLVFRRLPERIGSSDWQLLVRPEIAYQFGLGSVPDQ